MMTLVFLSAWPGRSRIAISAPDGLSNAMHKARGCGFTSENERNRWYRDKEKGPRNCSIAHLMEPGPSQMSIGLLNRVTTRAITTPQAA